MQGGGLNSYIIQGRGLRLSICATPARKWTIEKRQQREAVIDEIRKMVGQADDTKRGPHGACTWLQQWSMFALSQIDATFHTVGVNDNDQPCLS